jgi:hypothetical protein
MERKVGLVVAGLFSGLDFVLENAAESPSSCAAIELSPGAVQTADAQSSMEGSIASTEALPRL